MKLLTILLLFTTIDGHAQQITRWQGDSNFSVQLVSLDTSKVKVYNMSAHDDLMYGRGETNLAGSIRFTDSLNHARAKYDTIGPVWRLCCDTSNGWNPVSAMKVYEVREYVNGYVMPIPNNNVATDPYRYVPVPGYENYQTPRHLLWLDSNKTPLKLNVWE